MSESIIPGIKAVHCHITPVCRENRGNDRAFDEAVRRIRAEYDAITDIRTDKYDFHLVLTVQTIKGDE
jgi:hypothetical protein